MKIEKSEILIYIKLKFGTNFYNKWVTRNNFENL